MESSGERTFQTLVLLLTNSLNMIYKVVILINATKQFWYALQNPKWRSK